MANIKTKKVTIAAPLRSIIGRIMASNATNVALHDTERPFDHESLVCDSSFMSELRPTRLMSGLHPTAVFGEAGIAEEQGNGANGDDNNIDGKNNGDGDGNDDDDEGNEDDDDDDDESDEECDDDEDDDRLKFWEGKSLVTPNFFRETIKWLLGWGAVKGTHAAMH